jgi:hypothetical protein
LDKAAFSGSVALRVAERLGIRAVDPDRLVAYCAGDISGYINRFGYDVYARQNVETGRLMLQESTGSTAAKVFAGVEHGFHHGW